MALQPIFDGIQWIVGLSLGSVEPGSGSRCILNAGQKLCHLNHGLIGESPVGRLWDKADMLQIQSRIFGSNFIKRLTNAPTRFQDLNWQSTR